MYSNYTLAGNNKMIISPYIDMYRHNKLVPSCNLMEIADMQSIELYHHPLSVCSMKVRLALEEKGLAWSGRVVDIVHEQEQLEPWYLELNPNGVIPTLQLHNGATRVVTDSAKIIRCIAALPEGNRLIPIQEGDLETMEMLVDLADKVDLQILSYARHPSMENSGKILEARIEKSRRLAEQHPELKSNYEVCAERSEKSKSFRVDAEYVTEVEQQVQDSLAGIQHRLERNRFLVSDAYSLADVIWTVVLSRLELLGYTDWVDGENFPQVSEYYRRVKDRKSFSLAQIQNEWWEK